LKSFRDLAGRADLIDESLCFMRNDEWHHHHVCRRPDLCDDVFEVRLPDVDRDLVTRAGPWLVENTGSGGAD